MKQSLNISIRLMIICAAAAFILSLVNAVTEPQIEKVKQERLAAALETVSVGYKVGEAEEVNEGIVETRYALTDSTNNITGYILKVIGTGYAGDLNILASYNMDGVILAVKLMENEETPGLGKKAESDEYMEKFIGTGGDKRVPTSKSHLETADADSISGATITFFGVSNALNDGSSFIEQMGE